MELFGQENVLNDDVVVSCRVRIARNLAEFPFPNILSDKDAINMINKIQASFFRGNDSMKNEFKLIHINDLDNIERQILVEKHLISFDLATNERPSSVIISNDEKISIMINEEDHLRIQCIQKEFNISSTFELCQKLDILLEEENDFAFNTKYGYLTSCPTNLGTGIRASVMLHLPALTMSGYINEVLQNVTRLGMAVRGAYGEKSSALGNFFQVSNQKTMGQTEEGILTNVNNITYQIIDQERTLRMELYKRNKLRFEDKIFRSLGILTNARIISTEESLKFLSDVKLGIDMGIINDISKTLVDEIILKIQPGFLQKSIEKSISPEERDAFRSNIIREMLK